MLNETAIPQPTPPPDPTAAVPATLETGPDPVVLSLANPQFNFQGSDPKVPVVTHQPTAEIENTYINPGAVIFHDGQFHMFFNSFTSWPGIIKVGYLTSEDGLNWQQVQQPPVLTTDQIPFGKGYADVSSVVVLDDGTWVLYFHTIQERQIGLATAESPTGPWVISPEPVLEAGSEGAWDDGGLSWPNVVYDGQAYHMYYGGQSGSKSAIGLAISTDGLNWTKYNDPQTSDLTFATSDPVFSSSAKWELGSVDRPRAAYSPDGWAMIYAGKAVEKRGLALSQNGIDWAAYEQNPILTPDKFPNPGQKTWDTALLLHEGIYYYFMELGTLSGTDIYLAVHKNSQPDGH